MRHYYRLHGLDIESSFPLSSLPPGAATTPDLTIGTTAGPLAQDASWEAIYDVRTLGGAPFLTVHRSGHRYLVRGHDIADFVVDPQQRRITARAKGSADPSSVEQLLVDQILPRTLQLLGAPSLHASAVAFSGSAVALVGPSGAGKSTLCAACCEAGGVMLSDDCLRIDLSEEGPRAWPGYPSVRLWPDSVDLLAASTADLQLASARTTKRRAPYPLAEGPLPLAAIVSLRPGGPRVELAKLTGSAAISVLAGQTHRLSPSDEKALRREFETLSALPGRVSVYQLGFPKGREALGELVRVISRLATNHSTMTR